MEGGRDERPNEMVLPLPPPRIEVATRKRVPPSHIRALLHLPIALRCGDDRGQVTVVWLNIEQNLRSSRFSAVDASAAAIHALNVTLERALCFVRIQ